MSYWDTINPDSRTVDTPSSGPRLGFLGSLEASYDEQTRYANSFGQAIALQDEEQANRTRIAGLGETAPEPLDTGLLGAAPPTHRYTEFRDAYSQMDPRPVDEILGERNKQLEALKAKYPDAGILTYNEMMDAVRQKSDTARRRANTQEEGFLGRVGGFIGGAAGFMDPKTNPLGFATLALPGGFGESVLTRIAAEGLAQATAQAVQTPGSIANERALGGNPTADDALFGILAAGVGGALFRSVGEGVAGAGRRWFRSSADDPAPSPPEPAPERPAAPVQTTRAFPDAMDTIIAHIEGANTRLGRSRILADIDAAGEQLASWSTLPEDVRPPTSVRLPWLDKIEGPDITPSAIGETIDELARRVDPQTFALYDKAIIKQGELKAHLAEMVDMKLQADKRAHADIYNTVNTMYEALSRAKSTAERTQIRKDIRTFKSEQAAKLTGGASKLIADYIDALKKKTVEDLTPMLTRAYARAQGKWDVYEAQRAEIKRMVEAGRPVVSNQALFDNAMKASKTPDAAPAQSTLSRAVSEPLPKAVEIEAKQTEATTFQFRQSIAQTLAKEGDEALLTVEGTKTPLHLDKDTITIPNEDGSGERTISIRQMLQEAQEDTDMAAAVGSCSIKPAL